MRRALDAPRRSFTTGGAREAECHGCPGARRSCGFELRSGSERDKPDGLLVVTRLGDPYYHVDMQAARTAVDNAGAQGLLGASYTSSGTSRAWQRF